MIENKILLTECSDDKGLMAKIANICYKHQLNITHNSEFVDNGCKRFFMRTELEGIFNDEMLNTELSLALPQGAKYNIITRKTKRIVILVTKEAHCLGDILMKNYYGGLDVEIAAVIGNHDALRELVERFDIPFHHVSHENLTREEHDQRLAEKIDQYQPDLIILAKYMRVLNPKFVQRYPNRVINIHHSFLPAFIGAKPYQQAYERGVKIIGATAHFINDELDQGPIIMQNVINVDHTYDAKAMMRAGRDVEKSVLTRALDLALNDRIFVYDNKTVVL
ncbi:formyltetrahydrofolate deformylase [Testudinibacter aquarius]|uniref:Formyltetrahydrofolate deformylase n=1 Tax=Testudinibacter aquarius TaxID=1524974 RepID=A0A4R3Y7N7_9PAST|nr:formyltetrahydrofolate deformylase [Testudinibacter aquarius]TNG91239.1 formyltetrahydrofolate deformylase [Pasteurellaceae bacterium USgator41]TNG95054.1 formyltetrahydrofolate deformylase [Pasteurellaceae bacterium UScroc31]TNG98498.1 formyltetrahydrofolate deformylase [Pasteurellaceae bacterium USgator11]KAE9530297.1 formyltetrahydrofolate deformylase [Testudinibacter aquarius]TCV87850.1 formyltetrahydrofolate deformylase [Testudinibacter aquarius]